MGLGLEDVGWNLEPNPFLVHTLKKRITLETAGQESVQVNLVANGFEDFPNLLEQLLTLDADVKEAQATIASDIAAAQASLAVADAKQSAAEALADDEPVDFEAIKIRTTPADALRRARQQTGQQNKR